MAEQLDNLCDEPDARQVVVNARLAPTWIGVLPLLITAAAFGESSEARQAAGGELERMAGLADAVPAMLAALKSAEQFIVNGVDLGFIRMPDASTPDPAHGTLPGIRLAIALVEGR